MLAKDPSKGMRSEGPGEGGERGKFVGLKAGFWLSTKPWASRENPACLVPLVAAGDTCRIPAVLLGRHVPHAWEGPPGDKLDPTEGMLGVRKGMQRPRVRASPQDARREGNG